MTKSTSGDGRHHIPDGWVDPTTDSGSPPSNGGQPLPGGTTDLNAAPQNISTPGGLGPPNQQPSTSTNASGVWVGDLGSFNQAPSPLDSGSGGGSGGSTPSPVSGSGSSFVINVIYDSSVSNAPPAFTAAIQSAVTYLESIITAPITVNIDVGYGEIGGQSLESGALGESETYLNSYSYSSIKSALANVDPSAANSLPASAPGEMWLSDAQAESLGLAGTNNSGTVDAYAGFSSVYPFTYDPNNRAVAGDYDFIGVVEHEFTEDLGRIDLFNESLGGGQNGYSLLDLYHYTLPGVHTYTGTSADYFSVNGGVTNLDNFNSNPNGDLGDWAASAGNDSFLAFSNSGVENVVSQTDITEMNALGFEIAGQNGIVVAGPTSEAVQGGAAVQLASSVTITDAGLAVLVDATVKIANGSGAAVAGDELSVDGVQTGTVDGVLVTWNSSTNTLTLTGGLSIAEYESLLDEVSYQDTGTDNSSGSHPVRTVTWTFNDVTTSYNTTSEVTIDRPPVAENVVAFAILAATTSVSAAKGVLAGDTDLDGDTLTVSAVNGSAANVGVAIAGTYGELTLNANGSYTYVAKNGDVAGDVDHFTYTASDGNGGTATAALNITLDDALQALPSAVLTPVNEETPSWSLSASGGDGTLTYSLLTQAQHGTAVVNGNGTFTYTPTASYSGADSFQFEVTDSLGLTSTNTVSVGVGTPGYTVAQSLQFVASQSDYLTQTPAAAGNQQTWTWSGWVNTGSGTGVPMDLFTTSSTAAFGTADAILASLRLTASNQLQFFDYNGTTGAYSTFLQTNQALNANTWYQVTLVYNTTQSVAANRVELFVNGQQITSFSTQTDPAQNSEGTVNSAMSRYLSLDAGNGRANYFNGNLADVQFVDGQALSPTAFGESVNGVWEPNAYTGSYGTNGFHLTFASGAIGTDSSGEGNSWTPINLTNANVSSASPGGSGVSVQPTAGNDVLIGTGGGEVLTGGSGNDLFEGNGNATIIGGGGTNTAEFRGTRSQYTITLNAATGIATVTDSVGSRDGTQTLTDIQNLQFSDQTVAIGNSSSWVEALPSAVLTPVGEETPSWSLSASGGDGTLTYSLLTQAQHGTAVVNGNGTFTYTPTASYSGADSFQFEVTDSLGLTSTNTVSVGVGTPGYTVAQSLQFVASQSDYLTQTPAASGNQQTWTWSGWVNLSSTGSGLPMDLFTTSSTDATFNTANVVLASLRLTASNQLQFFDYNGTTGAYSTFLQTNQALNANTWYQVTLVYNTTQSVAANRVELFVNGQQITSFSTQTDPSQNSAGTVNSAMTRYLSLDAGNGKANYFNGNLADVQFVDGQALSPTSFGASVNGVWEPAAYTGSYGTNGYHLTFASGAIGTDSSGEGNSWTPVNLTNANVSSASPGGSGVSVEPTTGNDVFIGSGGGEVLTGGAGNDLFEGNGNATIIGGGGTNTAEFRGTRSQYTISLNAATGVATVTDSVSGRDGTQTLTDVQNLQFSNQTVSIGNSSSWVEALPSAVLTPVNEETPSWSLSASGGDGTLTYSLLTQAQHGTAVVNGNGTFTYTPTSGYSGADGFQFEVTDSLGLTSTNTVSVGVGTPGYTVAQSLQFVASQSDYLTQTPAAAGNQQTWTWSGWVNPGSGTGVPMDLFTTSSTATFNTANVVLASLRLNASNQLQFFDYNGTTGAYSTFLQTNQALNANTWYQVTLVYNTTQSVAANRVELFVNGQQITSFSTQTDPSQNSAGTVNSAMTRYLSLDAGNGRANYFNGNLADVQFVDGQALNPTSFGASVNGVWEPAAYTGSYGTNGFHLTFASGAIGTDSSGEGNSWTPVNLTNANVSSASPGGSGVSAELTLTNGVPVNGGSSDQLSGASVALTGGFAGDGDLLSANTVGTNISASWNSSNETLTLTGTDTEANYQSVLDQLVFSSTSSNPTDSGSYTTRTATWRVTDVDGAVSAAQSENIYLSSELVGSSKTSNAASGATLESSQSQSAPNGPATVATGATVVISGADSSSVTFEASTGTLQLDDPSTFTGQISGFTGNGCLSGSDQIDLTDFNYNSVQDSYSGGVLSVTDGTNSASLNFAGSYTLANFEFASDGNGGTIVYDPPVRGANSPSPGQAAAANWRPAGQTTFGTAPSANGVGAPWTVHDDSREPSAGASSNALAVNALQSQHPHG